MSLGDNMLEPIKGLVLGLKDPGLNPHLPLLPVGSLVKDFNLNLSNGRTIELEQVVKNGPLVLVFIRGTWCPFCRMHLSRLSKWVEKLKNKTATVIVVSTESVPVIKKWLQENQMLYLFASDEKFELSNYFGAHIDPNDFANAATFVIDSDKKIKMAYNGKRTDGNFEKINKVI